MLCNILGLITLIALAALLYWCEGQGRKSAENEQMKQVLVIARAYGTHDKPRGADLDPSPGRH